MERTYWPIFPRWGDHDSARGVQDPGGRVGQGRGWNLGAMPVMSYQPVGNGRVVVVEGAGMWRWAFLAADINNKRKSTAPFGEASSAGWYPMSASCLHRRMALRADKLTFGTDENRSQGCFHAVYTVHNPNSVRARIINLRAMGDETRLDRRVVAAGWRQGNGKSGENTSGVAVYVTNNDRIITRICQLDVGDG